MSQVTRLQELVYELRVSEVMTKEVITVTPQTSMVELKEILRQHRISGTPVVDGDTLVGVISVEDLIEALTQGDMTALAGERMTPNPKVLRGTDSLITSVNYFTNYDFGRFPVIDGDGNLIGILTQGDITRKLLKRLEVEYHAEEIRRQRTSHFFEDVVSDRTTIALHYEIAARDLERAGSASRKLKRVLKRLGVTAEITRRTAIVAYEAEMNIIIHASKPGGSLEVEIQPHQITLRATDQGPGIPDIEKAMQRGFSTAPQWIRDMGFGAGMGLKNIKKCADEMILECPQGTRTVLEVVIRMEESRLPVQA